MLSKPGRQRLCFCNFSQLPLSYSLFTVLFGNFGVFCLFLWLGIYVEVDVDRITYYLTPLVLVKGASVRNILIKDLFKYRGSGKVPFSGGAFSYRLLWGVPQGVSAFLQSLEFAIHHPTHCLSPSI